MSAGYWSNLRPFEKRVVVGFGALFFVVLNFLFVFPHFSDLNAAHDRMAEAQRKLGRYQNEFAQTNLYNAGMREFEKEGSDVAVEEQSYQFANAIQAQAVQSGVHILSNGRINTQTNQFFIEKSQTISVQGGEQQLVDFLFNLGSGGSQIRVRDLGMRPDQPRQQLVANVKVVANYQKKATARGAAPTSRPAAPATKPLTPAASPTSPTNKIENTKRP
jgi:type II secretory pathway component PulM